MFQRSALFALTAADLEDGDAVARVLIETRRVSLPFAPMAHAPDAVRAWVAHTLIPAGGVVVARMAGAVVGVLATSRERELGWIDQLYVLPRHQGQGLGTALLRHAHAALDRPIRLYTFQQNVAARRFYERHGYRAVAFSDGAANEEHCPDVLYELRA